MIKGTFDKRAGLAAWILAVLWLWNGLARAQTGQTVTWAGGNSYQSWSRDTNWNPHVVPVNNPGTNFTVIVPDYTSLTCDLAGPGAIDALSFGVSSGLRLTNGQGLEVAGVAIIKGLIEVTGAGSAFRAPANTIVLSANPRLLAWDGAQIGVGASTYSWDRYNGSATLLSAIGSGSLVDLRGVSTMQIGYGDNGSWIYTINARSNGVVDLSALANLTGPGSDDLLELNVGSGGLIKLDSVRQIAGATRFNVDVPWFVLPEATLMDNVAVNLSTGAGFSAPKMASVTNCVISVSAGAGFSAPTAASIANSVISVSTGAVFQVSQLTSIADSRVSIAPEGVFDGPQLTTLDNVPLSLNGNGAFVATNLNTYRRSDISIQPGKEFHAGLLTNIYGSRISVSGGTNFQVGAISYEMPPSPGYSYSVPPHLFSVDGSGSLLDLSSLNSVRVHGGDYWYDPSYGWNNSWTFSIIATNQGVIDLSGLETVYGADPSNYNGDDWLAFRVQNGGNILLPSLRQVTGRTRFDIEVPRFEMQSLETADNTFFKLSDGTRLDLPSLKRLDSSSIGFGFNSSFNAPQLIEFLNSDLNLGPGKILDAPPFTSINGSRIAVSSGVVLAIAATNYESPANWNWSPTFFSADGMGSMLNLVSLKSLSCGGTSGSYVYTIVANNNGVVDLSGLGTISSRGDWLVFSEQNGGNIRLSSLREATGPVRFALGAGTRLDLTNLTRLANGCRIDSGVAGILNAPRLVEFVASELSTHAKINSGLSSEEVCSSNRARTGAGDSPGCAFGRRRL